MTIHDHGPPNPPPAGGDETERSAHAATAAPAAAPSPNGSSADHSGRAEAAAPPSGTPAPASGPGAANPATARSARGRFADLSASLVVFLIAIPLSLGIALATGAPLQAGLVAAAVGGIVVGLLGGAPLQVSGPAAGLTVIIADLINTYGWRVTCAITILAGLIQIGLGMLRVARGALAVSPAIVHGMLAGIGATIALAQLHVVLGGSPESSALVNIAALPGQLTGQQPASTTFGLLTVLVLLTWPRLSRLPGRWSLLAQAPGALMAVLVATLVAGVTGSDVPRVDIPSWSAHAFPSAPEGPVLGLIAAVLTLTVVASVESLLSAVAVDKMHSGPRANLDRELVGQGVANVVSGSLGGLAVTGVAVRSTANVRSGARTRASATMHGVWVLLFSAVGVALLERIPLSSLGALVMVVGIQMVNRVHMRHVHRHREFPTYLVTAVAVLFTGVLEGVAIGIAVAVLTALRRLAHTRVEVRREAGGVRVRAHGSLTFLAVPRLSGALNQIPDGMPVVLELDVDFLDHAAFEAVQSWRSGYTDRGGTVEIEDVHGCWGRRATEDDATIPPLRVGPAPSPRWFAPWSSWQRRQGQVCAEAALLDGVREFRRSTAEHVQPYLARLAAEGQRPAQLFITCADSRIVPNQITSSGPGDLFTVRNIGNLVPRTADDASVDGAFGAGAGGDTSVAAALEYAVDVLRVPAITVCGHSGCGAMQALLDPGLDRATGLGRWLRGGEPSLSRMASRPAVIEGVESSSADLLSMTNVAQQLDNLMTHPSVRRRVEEGSLQLIGLFFDVKAAAIYRLDASGRRFVDLAEPSESDAGSGTEAGAGASGAPDAPEKVEVR
ncbi:SulP family inorganic anion transporter [Allostreptomyces psammosilenae]|uniref:carbonic anhydrase n=1 Tax=Allostreptomyces psammosilenae TaxID=1892865 RepID=A0A853A543_9ACTN|nr:bifunctional SulP family inorganic anion transporter/carbonic anhydrase [Allostreptomyces psammosilenae]NYI05612.1 carbonic anhydrase [Allostreptomyces psammosilenae]